VNGYDDDPLLRDALEDSAEAPARFWTRGRVIYALIALLMILALLAYTLWPLLLALTQPAPPPPTPPLPLNVI
jgi:hypothetical protein